VILGQSSNTDFSTDIRTNQPEKSIHPCFYPCRTSFSFSQIMPLTSIPKLQSKEERQMPDPKPPTVELTKATQAELEKLVKRHHVAQQIGLRGRIVLAAGAGKNNSQIVRDLHVSLDMVRLWRQRWLDLQPIALADLSVEERLEDLPRPGAPLQITAEQRCQIEALACAKPEKSGRPISHWTGREIADELMKRGIVAQISARHAGRLLKRGRSQTSPDPLLADHQTG
jgi:putative transposase